MTFFPDIEVHVGVDEVVLVEARIIGKEKLRIIGDYRTVEVVVAAALVDVVAHAGVEDEVHALVEQVLDMSVGELCRVAYRIRGDSVLTEIVHITGALVGNDRLKPSSVKSVCQKGSCS